MNIARIAQTRYTTKAFDFTKKIPADLIDQLRTVLRNSPSSINSQSWHFFVAASADAKARIAKAMHDPYAYNEPKVLNASHVIVLCARRTMDDSHLSAILAREEFDGRIATPEAIANRKKSCGYYINVHRAELKDESSWLERQVYIALGTLLLAAGALEIDACPIEGFHSNVLNKELGLREGGLHALVIVALGYRAADDVNAKLPKSRLPDDAIFTDL